MKLPKVLHITLELGQKGYKLIVVEIIVYFATQIKSARVCAEKQQQSSWRIFRWFCLIDQDHTYMLHHNVLASDGHIDMFIYIMHNSQLMEYARIIIADTLKINNGKIIIEPQDSDNIQD